MLLITRRAGEKIMVGDDVVFHIKEIVGNTVRVGIEAPRSTPIYRERSGTPSATRTARPPKPPFALPSPAPTALSPRMGVRSWHGLCQDRPQPRRR